MHIILKMLLYIWMPAYRCYQNVRLLCHSSGNLLRRRGNLDNHDADHQTPQKTVLEPALYHLLTATGSKIGVRLAAFHLPHAWSFSPKLKQGFWKDWWRFPTCRKAENFTTFLSILQTDRSGDKCFGHHHKQYTKPPVWEASVAKQVVAYHGSPHFDRFTTEKKWVQEKVLVFWMGAIFYRPWKYCKELR